MLGEQEWQAKPQAIVGRMKAEQGTSPKQISRLDQFDLFPFSL